MDKTVSKRETEIVCDLNSELISQTNSSTNVSGTNASLYSNFYMDISDKILYIKFDTCPPLYRYLGV